MSNQRIFTNEDLYRKVDGKPMPLPQDIMQDQIGNCYLLSVMQSVAQKNPSHISDLISFDPKLNNFSVRFYNHRTGAYNSVFKISQDDIWDNIARKGGSQLDNGDLNSPIWPALIEIAYLKKLAAEDGVTIKSDAYDLLDSPRPSFEALELITGIKKSMVILPSNFAQDKESKFYNLSKFVNDQDTVALLISSEDLPKKLAGTIGSHGYAIDSMGVSDDGEKYIAMRNPHNLHRKDLGYDEPLYSDDPSFVVFPFDQLLKAGGWSILITPNSKILPVDTVPNNQLAGFSPQSSLDLLKDLLESSRPENPIDDLIKTLNKKSPFFVSNSPQLSFPVDVDAFVYDGDVVREETRHQKLNR